MSERRADPRAADSPGIRLLPPLVYVAAFAAALAADRRLPWPLPAPLAASVTVLNRFIDFWLHIGLGILAWSLRRRLRLRTWSESPQCRPASLDDLRPAAG